MELKLLFLFFYLFFILISLQIMHNNKHELLINFIIMKYFNENHFRFVLTTEVYDTNLPNRFSCDGKIFFNFLHVFFFVYFGLFHFYVLILQSLCSKDFTIKFLVKNRIYFDFHFRSNIWHRNCCN